MAEREPLYRRLADIVVDTSDIPVDQSGGGDPRRPAGTVPGGSEIRADA